MTVKDIKGNRYYEVNGDWYPSVTSILNIISKGKFFDEWLAKNSANESKTKAETAANLGTRIHKRAELHIRGEELPPIQEDEIPAFNAFLKWEKEFKPEYLESEIFVYDTENKYAGTCDLIANINGFKSMVDIKTSARYYNTMNLQLAAYSNAYKQMHHPYLFQGAEKHYILRLDKTSGEWQFIDTSDEIHEEFKVFLAALKIFNWKNKEFVKAKEED